MAIPSPANGEEFTRQLTRVVNPDGSTIGQTTPNGDNLIDDTVDAYKVVNPDGTYVGSSTTVGVGTSVVGVAMSYIDGVARGITPGTTRKVLKSTGTLSSGALTLNSWTDQDGNSYTAVTTGKTLYIDLLIATLIAPSTTTTNAAVLTFGNATNKPVAVDVNSGAVIPLHGIMQIASTLVPTASFASGLNDSAAAVTIIGWEE